MSRALETCAAARDRFVHTLDPVSRTRIDVHLGKLRANVSDADLRAAQTEAERLRGTLQR